MAGLRETVKANLAEAMSRRETNAVILASTIDGVTKQQVYRLLDSGWAKPEVLGPVARALGLTLADLLVEGAGAANLAQDLADEVQRQLDLDFDESADGPALDLLIRCDRAGLRVDKRWVLVDV